VAVGLRNAHDSRQFGEVLRRFRLKKRIGCMIHGRFDGDCGSGGFGLAFQGIRRGERRSEGEDRLPSSRRVIGRFKAVWNGSLAG
jgi:hypothetical protein